MERTYQHRLPFKLGIGVGLGFLLGSTLTSQYLSKEQINPSDSTTYTFSQAEERYLGALKLYQSFFLDKPSAPYCPPFSDLILLPCSTDQGVIPILSSQR